MVGVPGVGLAVLVAVEAVEGRARVGSARPERERIPPG